MSFHIEVHNLSEEERRLAQLGVLLRDLRPFWPRVVPLFVSWMGHQFDSEGRFFGDGWVALSPAYKAWKDLQRPGKRILSFGGHPGQTLRGAATSPRRIATPLFLELRIDPYDNDGTTIEPSWFQEGTDRMPARPLLSEELLPSVAMVELDRVAEGYAQELVRRLGL